MAEVSAPMRRVLALDGGGIKGVFIASFLAEIEEACDSRIVDNFDLIVGTSTGGIVALGLASGLSAREVLNFYEDRGPKIFRADRRRVLRGAVGAKYDRAPITEALNEVFGDRRLGECETRVMVPSLNLETGEVHVFKTAHQERFIIDYKERIVEVALATAAAPVYFPTHRLQSGVPLIDGGMWANNPMGPAAVEAVGVLGWVPESTRLLSVGCTEAATTLTDRTRRGHGVLFWANRIAETFMAGQSSASIGTAQHLLGHHNVYRVSPLVARGRYALDGVKGIESLKALGAAVARSESAYLTERFFSGKREPFHPFREVHS